MKSILTLLFCLGFYLSFSQANITAMEYYLDDDPGFGNGTDVPIAVPAPAIDIDFTIPNAVLSLLPTGFHTLVIRTQDANLVWSVQESTAFFISADDPLVTSTIDAAEYYIDDDPGVGNGTDITTLVSGTSIDTDFIVPTDELTAGFHSLVIRLQDSGGQWSVQESKAIFVSSSDPFVTSTIVAAEYFIDEDPGVGMANVLTFASGTAVDFNFIIPNSDLTEGFHSLVIRVQDANGQWGVQETVAFFVSNTNPTGTTLITDIEYFVDEDPGVGNATNIDITDMQSFDETMDFVANGLAAGMHTVYIRALDEMGVWSMLEARNFLVDGFRSEAPGSGITTGISSVEYFIDTDPGYGAATQIAIAPSEETIDQDFVIATSSLAPGAHTLGVRVANEFGLTSQTEYSDFTLCDGADVQTEAAAVCIGEETIFTDLSTGVLTDDVYSWDFDGDGVEDDNTVGNTAFTFGSAGTFSATLTISNASCFGTTTISVIVNDLPVVQANASSTDICFGEEVTLTGSGGTSYAWDNDVMDNVSFSPTTTATYAVTGTDANGCENTAAIEIEVITVDKPTITIDTQDFFDAALSSSSSEGNQWFKDGTLLAGETNQTYNVEESGSYTVQVTSQGCTSEMSEPEVIEILGLDDGIQNNIIVWPNPTDAILHIQLLKNHKSSAKYRVVDIAGSVVIAGHLNLIGNGQSHNIDVSILKKGIYFFITASDQLKVSFIKD